MQTQLQVIKQQDYDRYVFLTYSENNLIGLNFHQGTDEIIYDYAKPCPKLTEMFFVFTEHNPLMTLENRINLSIQSFVDAYIFQKETLYLPDAQKKLIRKALEYYKSQYEHFNSVPTDTENYEIFDLMTLQALCNYQIEVKLSKDEVENFTSDNNIDLPVYHK
jgi:hypothetical protein